MPEARPTAPRGYLYYRHTLPVRILQRINVIALTILAYELNDKTLPIANGAPLRVRIERQLGYKMAKYILRIELVDSFANIADGKGGYWEDQGYQWYAGI